MKTAALKAILSLSLALATVGFAQNASDDPFGPVEEKEPHVLSETEWFGKNGKSIRGRFVEEKDGLIHVMDVRTKKVYKLDRENLAPKTTEWFDRAKARDLDGKKPEVAQSPFGESTPTRSDGLEPLDQDLLERSRIKPSNPKDYGLRSSGTVHPAFAPFFIWWDQNSNLQIPKGRTFKAKVQWLHKELNHCMEKDDNKAPDGSKIKGYLEEYFNENYKGEASFSLNSSSVSDIDQLVKATSGGDATVLRLHAFSKEKPLWTIDSSLVEVKPDGRATLIVSNAVLTGKIEELPQEDAKKMRLKKNSMEFNAGDLSDLPRNIQRVEPRFILNDLYVFRPRVKPDKEVAPAE